MSLPSGLFDNEDEDSNTLSLGEKGNTPFYETTTRPERDEGTGVKSPTIAVDTGTLGSGDRVIMTFENPHDVKWPVDSSVTVVNATWQGRQSDDKVETIKFVQNPNVSFGMPRVGLFASSRDVHTKRESPEFEFLTAGGGLRLPVNDTAVSAYLKKEMYLVLGWSKNDGTGTGYTQSGVFTVYNGSKIDQGYAETKENILSKITSDAESAGQDIDSGSEWAPRTTTGVSSSITSTSTATSAPSSTPPPGAGSSNSSSSSGGGGGLSAGAIAGIVIGSILGVALIAFLLWFLIRRRRRANNVHSGGYGSGPHEFLADKENHARVTESPHSPYSDDGHQQQEMQQSQRHLTEPEHDAAVPAAAAAAVTPASGTSPTERRSFAPPYSEEEHMPTASRSLENVNRDAARSSTPNVNSNVSHLIEDGMTEDEIRRLEEEERALDAAIEQAGQGGGQGQRR
ncbi:hypothetical protein GCG54_00009775 [Colletotrichum gloeosporioides]|uniref:Uncharacterized protein n=1 Tax=Colletotrichum gloeosporioides TaxID=474922 RepID=A0A8H4CFR0_COLGL|nr:uncharacterized protein GCG54_00009775 [Colletotrichum gloeosporioides]KAF3803078.1 hypothetical protein GCG54_00009775 [Colletotrichum gloeosporioides]